MASRDARIALLGATGTVGSQITELLGERHFPYSELKLFARESSGRTMDAGEGSLPVDRINRIEDLSAFDIAFLAIPRAAATEIIEAHPGPVLVDLSAATAPPNHALVAPGVTPHERIAQFTRGQVLAVPHPAAQLIATILRALGSDGFAAASIMLSASAAGHQGVSELFQQSADLLNARLDVENEPQVGFNVFVAEGARDLARALTAQVRVLGADSSQLLLDLVRVPAFHGSAVSLFLPAREMKTQWPELLRAAPGLIVLANDDAAGFIDAVGQDGALARISLDEAGAVIWCSFDAARLAALTAVWIAEALRQEPVSD